MTTRNNVNAMAERYKAEMMRIYSRSSDKDKKKTAVQEEKNEAEVKEKQLPVLSEKPIIEDSPPPKFLSPDEILAAERNDDTVPAMAQASEGKGNYSSAEGDPIQDENPIEPLYSDSGKTQPFEEMTGKGYIKAEITTAGGALPIENAVVLITRRENGRTLLVKMLTTDRSGITDTAELPAPNIIYSESPDSETKPFAEYILSVYADGFYAVPEIILPVFTTVKSIQPVSLIPLAKFDSPNSQLSDRNIQ